MNQIKEINLLIEYLTNVRYGIKHLDLTKSKIVDSKSVQNLINKIQFNISKDYSFNEYLNFETSLLNLQYSNVLKDKNQFELDQESKFISSFHNFEINKWKNVKALNAITFRSAPNLEVYNEGRKDYMEILNILRTRNEQILDVRMCKFHQEHAIYVTLGTIKLHNKNHFILRFFEPMKNQFYSDLGYIKDSHEVYQSFIFLFRRQKLKTNNSAITLANIIHKYGYTFTIDSKDTKLISGFSEYKSDKIIHDASFNLKYEDDRLNRRMSQSLFKENHGGKTEKQLVNTILEFVRTDIVDFIEPSIKKMKKVYRPVLFAIDYRKVKKDYDNNEL